MKKHTLIYLPIGILTGLTVISGAVLTNSGAKAATDSKTQQVSVTVASACQFYNSSDKTSSKTISNGSSSEFSGMNTMTAVCNNASGVQIRAIGNTVNSSGTAVSGSNVMRLSGTSTTFASGTATSGTASNWAMKVADGGGANTASIQNSFGSYKTVPTTATKVAQYAGATTTTTGMAISTSYRVYIGTLQQAGTYTGAVKYTVAQGVN